MIIRLNNVPLYVTDQERSREFYVDKLGFEVRTDAEMGPGRRWLEVAPVGAQTGFAILKGEDFENVTIGGSAPATLSATDVTALYEELTAKGVAVTAPMTEPWSTWVKITDPDGWELIVGERL
jgi:catechol 2,3-dioxygenase-like lactoylglutathione lyase family enzyme